MRALLMNSVLVLGLMTAVSCSHYSRHGGHGEHKAHGGKGDCCKGSSAEMSAEKRKSMAEKHQKMADCLKSDKPMSECKKEMMANCSEDGCSIK